MSEPKTARERFVEAMRKMLAAEFCCGTLNNEDVVAACDAFADLWCDAYHATPKSHVREGEHDECRAALRKEVFGE